MLTVTDRPRLHAPVLVVALTGWVDAGNAGTGAIAVLREQCHGERVFATCDLADRMDLQQTRPVARWAGDGDRVIDWPVIEFVAGTLGRDVVLVTGPEPSLRWQTTAGEIVALARDLGVEQAFTLAGMPALVSHRRPVPVFASATSRSLAQEVAPLRAPYAGPTGLQTVLQRMLGDAGIPALGLWAQVPQYVSGSPSPAAVSALVGRLAEIARLDVDLRPLDRRSEAYRARVDAGLAARPDVAEVVDRIDRETTELPSGDELASEIERFLRDQTGD